MALATRFAVVVAAGLIDSPASADAPQTAALSWVMLAGAEDCGSAQAFARQVDERIGRPALVSLSRADVSIDVRVARNEDPPGWHAIVEERDGAGVLLGTRNIDSPAARCDDLRESVALAVALMVDPEAGSSPAEHAPADKSPVDSAVRADAHAAPEVLARDHLPPTSWRAAMGASVGFGYGLLPSVAFGVTVDAIVEPPKVWAFEAFGAVWEPQNAPTPNGSFTRLSLRYAGLATCPFHVENEHRQALRICAGAQVGSLQGSGTGYDVTRSGSLTTFDAVVAGRLVVPLAGPLAFGAGLKIDVALAPGRFVYEAGGAQEEVFRRSAVALAGDLGVSVGLP